MTKPLEKEIQRAILDYLALFPRKVFAWRANTGGMKVDNRFIKFGIAGQADITGILASGQRIEIEVKRPGQKLSALQAVFGQCITRMGGVYIVASSTDDVAQVLGLEK